MSSDEKAMRKKVRDRVPLYLAFEAGLLARPGSKVMMVSVARSNALGLANEEPQAHLKMSSHACA